jgi:hypothetical protein
VRLPERRHLFQPTPLPSIVPGIRERAAQHVVTSKV